MKDQIIGSYLHDFCDQFHLADLNEAQAFERFVNHCVISKHHPDPFDPDDVTVGGSGDLGLDGVGIIVNDHLVFDRSAIDYLKRQLKRLDAQFIFVQSKTSGHFDCAEIGTFIHGVRQFFNRTLPLGADEYLKTLHDLKEYIFKSSIDMDRPPICRLYYATTGIWKEDAALRNRTAQGINDLTKTDLFSSVEFLPIDSEGIRRAYRELHNKILQEFIFEKHTILPTISGVQEAYIGIIPCLEYLKLLQDETGTFNRRLFYDNVRDFQGHNPVNTEIMETVVNCDTNDRFALLNNGVTVVARDLTKIGAKFRLKDYQIVNGCQTSHTLHMYRQHLTDKVFLPLKLIVTDDSDVTNQIIQGTNRQTEVKLEAFESLAPFQKKLEEFYLAVGRKRALPLYYERRSKQYDHLEIGREGIVTLPTQIKCFVAMFLNEPHSTHRYYGELLSSYRSKLFNESHLPMPYFTAAATLAALERLFSRGFLPRALRNFRFQLLMIFRLQSSKRDAPALNSKAIEDYCQALLDALEDEETAQKIFLEAAQILEHTRQEFQPWREPPERTRAFTIALIEKTRGYTKTSNPVGNALIRGEVKWFSDVKGYGFVTGEDGSDAFIHQSVVVASGGQSLFTGQPIRFAVAKTNRGLKVVEMEYL